MSAELRGRGLGTQRYTRDEIEKAIGRLDKKWARNCHAASLAIVNAHLYPKARVARGWCEGVGSQHSWVVIGNDCYDCDALILDVTLWSYVRTAPYVLYTTYAEFGRYHPHGAGHIITDLIPQRDEARDVIKLKHLSLKAQHWLRKVAPNGLDYMGWHHLASHAAAQGWPAKEILTAMYRDVRTRALIPIDRVGMLTDINPGGLYLASAERYTAV